MMKSNKHEGTCLCMNVTNTRLHLHTYQEYQNWPVGKDGERTVGINWPALGKLEEEHQLDLPATPYSSKPRRPPSVVLRGLLFAHSLFTANR